MSKIEIKEVKSKSDLNKFIAFPNKLYKGNKYRVPQLNAFEKSTLSPKKNPAFDFCEAKYWLAYKNGKIVGRIAGIINHKSNEIWKEKYVRFGWIDFIDDYDVSAALIKTVEDWAKSLNMEAVHGPLGFSDLDLEGMLVEGFSEISTQAEIYNYPYYPVHLEKIGYIKDVDWIQLKFNLPKNVPEKIIRVAEIVKKKYNLKLLKVKKAKEILPYVKSMFNTLNESYENLYGFVPLSEKQISYYTKQYFSMVNPKYVGFVIDEKDEVIAFGLSFFSLSKALMKAKGKLFPFGFIPILKAMKKNDTIDLLLHAVKPKYQNKGIPAIFYADMTQACIDDGIKTAITSHILEDNKPSLQMFNAFDTQQYLRHRIYVKKNI
ncbi:MAG: hypothetical protein DRJ01_18080 [Bacteroidetes bacterium]|nr:MAG: hypothetical protein DRJ01_18080 [Bacteroidota bacterium]